MVNVIASGCILYILENRCRYIMRMVCLSTLGKLGRCYITTSGVIKTLFKMVMYVTFSSKKKKKGHCNKCTVFSLKVKMIF